MPGLILSPLVSVKPMTAPLGALNFMSSVQKNVIGEEICFKVSTLEALLWLRDQADVGPSTSQLTAERVLQGISSDGTHCVSLFLEEFRVLDGLGQVQTGGGLEISGLSCNEGYADFLLTLHWRSPFGWPTEMHVLGIASYDGVEEVT